MAAPTHQLIAEVSPYSKSGERRLNAMGKALWRIDEYGIPGDIVECGVWRGGNIILARKLCPTRVCWLYDTFCGMTEPTAVDMTRSGSMWPTDRAKGKSAVSVQDVRANFMRTETLDDHYLRFVEGPVEHTLMDTDNLPERIAILRLDTDWYASTKIELEVLYPRLVPSGYLIVDDYGHWMGARKAVNDYFGSNRPEMKTIDYSAILIRKSC